MILLNKNEIESLIPHRDPFLFLDKCEIIEIGFKGVGYKVFKNNEYFFKGHFPDKPIVPGVILIEALAQTAGIVVSKGFPDNTKKTVLFTSILKGKFRKPVLPNDEIAFYVKIINSSLSIYKFHGEAKKNSEKMCESIFSAMVIAE